MVHVHLAADALIFHRPVLCTASYTAIQPVINNIASIHTVSLCHHLDQLELALNYKHM